MHVVMSLCLLYEVFIGVTLILSLKIEMLLI